MRARRVIGATTVLAGVAAVLVGVLHFVMAGHLEHWVAGPLDAAAAARVVPAFRINHTGSGVFLILLGAVLAQAGYPGLWRGKRWGAVTAGLIGAGLAALAVALWATVPAAFLRAVPFRVALLTLGAVGALTALPPLLFWKHFGET
jgi:hypothetical protein